jgi:hypothetical protein
MSLSIQRLQDEIQIIDVLFKTDWIFYHVGGRIF